MREYELVVIIHPDLDENAVNEVVTRISNWITEDGGEITKTDFWGKRELAYLIRKIKHGQYVLLQAKMNPTLGAKLERNLGYLESVLRYMLIARD
jgi:small subunit ribosomal protein S6